MRLVFDIEANGLYDTADIIWCICTKDLDKNIEIEWTIEDDSLNKISFLLHISMATELIGHNIINYDLPLLKKLWNWEPNENTKITDTLVMSRLANPDRPKPPGYTGKAGPHGLEAWGYRVGKGKLHHEEWNVFSPDMLRRCRTDVEINQLVYYTVSDELKEFSDVSIQIEHDFAKIITDQEHRGIRFDREKGLRYVQDLSERIEKIDEEIIPLLSKELVVIGPPVTKPFLVTGEYRKQTRDYIEDAYNRDLSRVIVGPYTRVRFDNFDLRSGEKVKKYLLGAGWIPDDYNYSKSTGERLSPKLSGEFRGIDGEIPRRVKERITWRHRRSQIEGWINNTKEESKGCWTLPSGGIPCGTPTGRVRHNTVVNIPKANSDKKTGELIWDVDKQKDVYGTQMRSLFIPRDGFVLVGHDASGLELRMLAHYLNDEEFTKELLSGDIHTYNQIKAGLSTRDQAKTFIYALIYGAGDEKIGSIVGGSSEEGKDIKSAYFSAIPKLQKFIDSVKRASSKGYLKGLDGRKLIMRKDDYGRIRRSAAPNTLLQAAGAIVMKKSCVILWDNVRKQEIEAYKVLDMHDEGQSEVVNSPKHLEPYCKLAVQSIIDAGKHFNLNIPLDAEYKIGNNMAETH
jgi:DNA polymerase I-like protein with 3'-5' exonuclease and polymerase domains